MFRASLATSALGNLTSHCFHVNMFLRSWNVCNIYFSMFFIWVIVTVFHFRLIAWVVWLRRLWVCWKVAVCLRILDVRLMISFCLFQWPNSWTLCVFCFRGAGGTTGTTGRATMSNTAAWMTWCCSARSMRTPSWTTSRRDTWMTTSLYPLLALTVHTPVRNSGALLFPAIPRIAEWSFAVTY